MNKRIKKLWIEALRSPYAKQIDKVLFDTDDQAMCCLGVLCQIHAEQTGKGIYTDDGTYIVDVDRNPTEDEGEDISFPFVSDDAELPIEVAKWADLGNATENDLIQMNDNAGASFAEIANYIEKNL